MIIHRQSPTTSPNLPSSPHNFPPQEYITLNSTSKLTLTSVSINTGNNGSVSGSRSNVLSSKVGQECSISAAIEGSGRSESIELAGTAEVRAADSVGGAIGRREQLSRNRSLDRSNNVLEHVTLSEDVATSANLEGVAGVLEPVVVDLAYVLVNISKTGICDNPPEGLSSLK